MNKKILVTAMGMALAGGMSLANADVKLYGQLDMSIDATDVDGGADDVNMGSNRSAIGFKGSEDLGNGLSAFFKSEWQVDLDDAGTGKGTNEDDTNEGDGKDGWKARDQYIGMAMDGVGKITFGMMSTAYKSPASKLDPFYRTRNQARNVGLQSTLHKGRGEEGEGRATNTIRIDTASFGGFKAFATYTLDNNENDDGVAAKTAADENDNPWSVGASFKQGGIYAFASYITTDGGGNDDAWQIGGKFSMDAFAVWGIYEADGGLITLNQYKAADANSPTNRGFGDGADIWSVGASFSIANNIVTFDYGQGDKVDSAAVDGSGNPITSDDYAVWRLGAKHNFSKRTNVYITHSNYDADEAGETDITSIGMRHNF